MTRSPRRAPRALSTLAVALALAVFASPARGGPGEIARTRHNLSVSGPGPIRAVKETRICVFCHTPHSQRVEKALWNRGEAEGPFLHYTSPSMDAKEATALRPLTGSSKLCMACHDGTVALGAFGRRRSPEPMTGTESGRIPPRSRSNLGHDLSGSHPVSLRVTPELVAENNARDSLLAPVEAMRSDPDVHLDASGEIQCTTCHDPHDDSNFESSGVHFYRKPRFSDVCTVCHKL